ncbi:hypothetical protein FJ420_30595 [Mesorhizobium sp. B3-1-3]|uniref:hypothetical protein n=1 Tax=unclassified Mesorhizobium TaxID=325217 RepID=UPI00112E35F4|nr:MULTISPECIES: hypothetical protein [unclassified Mesorhizobium]TPI54211.1 hypothetical protein FJ424_31455 [Mesorhizobium sp. B3-1-8]TPI61427.1 hypothetical protein FJ420_30595 [Mesorhizobium sp. B3-1-3]
MTFMRAFVCVAGAIVILSAPTMAQDEQPQPTPTQRFKLDQRDGCYRYIGDAVEFVGHFKAGSYIGISMITIGRDGLPTPAADEERTPAMDLPEWKSTSPHFWFGPTTASRDYAITFVPRAAWGSAAIVTICGRQTPPEN